MSLSNGSNNAVPKPFEGIWEGENKIVIGIDIGTTQSGVAFAFLEQGGKQEVDRVTHWPGQEGANMQSKFPTLVWYDRYGKAVSCGAEALTPQAEENAEDQGWQLAKHFKLHLHPSDMKAKSKLKMEPLPTGVSLRQIYTDFLTYLLKHTETYFKERVVNGPLIWENHRSEMEVVIAHPNGWGIREQSFLRDAAVNAGFTAASTSHKIRFVTEAEASVHFCINRTNLGSCLKPGARFAVCDAGGSTVDTTVYAVTEVRPMLKLEEARASACVQAGAIYVDAAAKEYLRKVLTEESNKPSSRRDASLSFDDVQEYIARGVKDFETVAKRSFRDPMEEKTVEIAGTRYNNPAVRTRRGRMTLPGLTVKLFFDGCVNEITMSVDQQVKETNVSYMLLVGGFGDSPFLRQTFKSRYETQGCEVTLTNDSTSKAVAEGAVIWNVVSSVVGRAPRLSFGIEIGIPNVSSSPEYRGRQTYMCASGEELVEGAWSQIVAKGIVIDADAINRRSFSSRFSTPNPNLKDFQVTLLSYSKHGEPKWTKSKKGHLVHGFQKSCTITANLGNASRALRGAIGVRGKIYWILPFDICIRFGGTELEAYMEWEEDGTTRTGEVTVVPGQPI